MSRTIQILLIAALLSAAFAGLQRSSVMAQNETYKIGVVNVRQVGASYDKYKSKYEELDKQRASIQAEIDRKRTELDAARTKYENDRKGMTPEAANAMELKIRADLTDYQAELAKGQQKMDSMTMEMNVAVFKDIQETVDKVAEQGGYHLIFSNERGPTSAILYASNTIDLTSRIVEALNKR